MSVRISNEPVTDSLLQAGIDWASVDSSTRHIASALRELQQSRALVTELQSNAATWHRLVEAFASILDIDSSGSAEQLGKSIADKIRGYQRMQSELRALAERKKVAVAAGTNLGMKFPYAYGRQQATSEFLSELTSLLAAHDTQQAEGSP